MKLIGLGIFAGKKAVYENTLHLMQWEVTNNILQLWSTPFILFVKIANDYALLMGMSLK